jgi:hypothetical protein
VFLQLQQLLMVASSLTALPVLLRLHWPAAALSLLLNLVRRCVFPSPLRFPLRVSRGVVLIARWLRCRIAVVHVVL